MSSQSVITPQFASITNQFLTNRQKGECNPFQSHNNFGNYFKQCSPEMNSAYWGSNKPTPDKCLQPQTGKPCHSLWNNLTRRKSVVDYQRK